MSHGGHRLRTSAPADLILTNAISCHLFPRELRPMQFGPLQRREFITLLGGGAVAAWPTASRAQQPERMRRVGVLAALSEDDSEMQRQVEGFRQSLERLGGSDGRNVRIEVRFARVDVNRYQALSKELVALNCDVILAHLTPVASALQPESRTIPIVF